MNHQMTLQQRLNARKYRIPNQFCYGIYYFVMNKLVGRKYHPTYRVIDSVGDCNGPCFLIWNHLSRIDHLYAMSLAYPRPISIVAGYSEFFRSHLHTVFHWMNILPKKCFAADIPGIRAINSVIKQGGCVCFAPEGTSSLYGRNQPVVAGTGKFLKHYRIPVYFMELHGQYCTSTKHCLDERYGKTEATLSLLFSPEQLESMTAEEIEARVNEVFCSDDYRWSKEHQIRWKHKNDLAKNLEWICYRCPKCGQELTIRTEGNTVRCEACGNSGVFEDDFSIRPADESSKIFEFPTDWVAWEREQVIREIREHPDFSVTEHVKLGYLPPFEYVKKPDTTTICGEGDVTIDHAGFHFSGTKLGKPFHFDLTHKEIYTFVEMTDMCHFGHYLGGEYYEFFPERPVVGKLLLLTEELHRLYFNDWKNLPCYDYMYQGMKMPESIEE